MLLARIMSKQTLEHVAPLPIQDSQVEDFVIH